MNEVDAALAFAILAYTLSPSMYYTPSKCDSKRVREDWQRAEVIWQRQRS